jgi:hypothetical protein
VRLGFAKRAADLTRVLAGSSAMAYLSAKVRRTFRRQRHRAVSFSPARIAQLWRYRDCHSEAELPRWTGTTAKPNTHIEQPLCETDQTYMTFIKALFHQNVTLANTGASTFIVSLDNASVTGVSETGTGNPLRPGDFKWIAIGQTESIFKNNSDNQAG